MSDAAVLAPYDDAVRDTSIDKPGELARRWIVALVVLVFLLLIGEGAIRKWVLPSWGRYLFFVRDPFVILAYALALTTGWWPKKQGLLDFGVGFGAIGLLLATVQLMIGSASLESQLVLAVYGWRNYFLYIPLPFLIGATFRHRDVALVVKLTLLLSAPIATLAFMQFFAPLGSPINVGISDDLSLQFRGLGLMGTRTRPMGPFTSDVGQREYNVVLTAMILAMWLVPARKRVVPFWLLAVATGAAFTSLAIGGSRGAVLHGGIIVLAAVASAAVSRGGAAVARAVLLPFVLVVLAVAAYPVVFPEGFEAFTSRWVAANASEAQHFQWGVFGRALYGLVDFLGLMGSTPILGYGLGLAGNASILLGVEIEGFNGWAESDWARHMVDLGPVFGAVFIGFRIVLVVWLFRRALVATRSRGDPLPLLLCAFVGVELFQGQITGHGSVNGFAWLFTGIALAAARTEDSASDSAPGAVVEERRFQNLMR